MARITVEDCIDKFPSRFELVLVASQRARKLHSGEEPTLDRDNDKNTVIALREIAETSFTVDEMKENLIQEYQTVTISDEEEENLEIESFEENDKIVNDSNENIVSEVEVKDIDSKQEIEEEMTQLISSEDKELEENYEIKDAVEESNSSDLLNNQDDLLEEKNSSESLNNEDDVQNLE